MAHARRPMILWIVVMLAVLAVGLLFSFGGFSSEDAGTSLGGRGEDTAGLDATRRPDSSARENPGARNAQKTQTANEKVGPDTNEVKRATPQSPANDSTNTHADSSSANASSDIALRGRIVIEEDLPFPLWRICDVSKPNELRLAFFYIPPQATKVDGDSSDAEGYSDPSDMSFSLSVNTNLGKTPDLPYVTEGARWALVLQEDTESLRHAFSTDEKVRKPILLEAPPLVSSLIQETGAQGGVINFGDIRIKASVVLGFELAEQDESFVAMGRFVHATGRPLKYLQGMGLVRVFENGSASDREFVYVPTTVDVDGRFVVRLEEFTSESAAKAWRWLTMPSEASDIYDSGPYTTSDPELGIFALQQPAQKGAILDFGDIVIDAPALEVMLGDWEGIASSHNEKELLADGGLENGPHCSCRLRNGDWHSRIVICPKPHSVTVMLPVGMYEYEAEFFSRDNQKFYDTLQGNVRMLGNAIMPLVLKPEACLVGTIVMRNGLDDKAGLITPRHDYQMLREGEALEKGWLDSRGQISAVQDKARAPEHKIHVPLRRGWLTHVLIWSVEFEVAHVVLSESRPEVTLRFTERSATLDVVLPWRPEKTDLGTFTLYIVPLENKAAEASFRVDLEQADETKKERKVLSLAGLRSGDHVVGLHSETAHYGTWGYAKAPKQSIEMHIEAGKHHRLELGELPPAPWPFAAGSIQCSAACGGRKIELHARDVTTGATTFFTDTWQYGHGIPQSLKDGDKGIPVSVSPPQDAGGVALVHVDVPVRVEVMVRGVVTFEEPWYAALVHPDGVRCQARIDGEGKAFLWCPPGQAEVEITTIGTKVLTKRVEIRHGDIVYVDFNAEANNVLWAWDERYSSVEYQDSTGWYIAPLDGEDGDRVDEVGDEQDKARYLRPGQWLLFPEMPRNAGDLIAFTVTEGQVQTVEIPWVPKAVRSGTLRMMLPSDVVAQARAGKVYFYFSPAAMVPVASRMAPLADYDLDSGGASRLEEDAVVMYGLPLDTELVVWGNMTADESREGVFIGPLSVVCDETGRATVTDPMLRPLATLTEEWWHLREESGVEVNLQVSVEIPWLGNAKISRAWPELPPGTYTMQVDYWNSRGVRTTLVSTEIEARPEGIPLPPAVHQQIKEALSKILATSGSRASLARKEEAANPVKQ